MTSLRTRARTAVADRGLYLYGIVRAGEERELGDGVRVVAAGGLGAVAGDAAGTEPEASRANLLAHERVLERVMAGLPVLPVRFGTVTPAGAGAEGVRRLLVARHDELDALLREVEPRVELGLRATWRDERAVLASVAAESPAVRAEQRRLRGRGQGATTMDRVRLGRLVKDALDRRRAALAARVLAPLRHLSVRVVENPVPLDRMILNAAFLVDREREGDFDLRVRELDEALAPDVALRYVGPVPPYNFVRVTVDWSALEGGRWA